MAQENADEEMAKMMQREAMPVPIPLPPAWAQVSAREEPPTQQQQQHQSGGGWGGFGGAPSPPQVPLRPPQRWFNRLRCSSAAETGLR